MNKPINPVDFNPPQSPYVLTENIKKLVNDVRLEVWRKGAGADPVDLLTKLQETQELLVQLPDSIEHKVRAHERT
ncbi:MAG: hypothetical protein AAFR35_14315 [Pseudomonadota bacterium]